MPSQNNRSSLGNPFKRPRTEVFQDGDLALRVPGDGVDTSSISQQSAPATHFQLNWQYVLCETLDLSPGQSDCAILDALHHALGKVRNPCIDKPVESRYQVIHRVQCEYRSDLILCLNEPIPRCNEHGNVHLSGVEVIDDLEAYLERHTEIIFLVYKDYQCCLENDVHTDAKEGSFLDSNLASSMVTKESINIVSKTLTNPLVLLWSYSGISTPCPFLDEAEEFDAPYLWWYHHKDQLSVAVAKFDHEHQKNVKLFQAYIMETLSNEYRLVDELLSDNKMMMKYLPYLYVLGEVQLSKLDGNNVQFHKGFEATSELQRRGETRLEISGINWTYNGLFQKMAMRWAFKAEFEDDQIFEISELDVFPLRFAAPEIRKALEIRGQMFWSCRHQKYVCYGNDVSLRAESTESRYMVDHETYREMYPAEAGGLDLPRRDDLGPEATQRGADPPSTNFLYCLPHQMTGYDMQKKTWDTLFVSRITEVEWNEEAFSKLVIDESKKELIQALVTTHISKNENADLISGKGNGLFILLHGGPGTGKTLTAESVAEIARRPLYRVTCGDVGTKAEDVEKYLEMVLLLGKTWGCVVLLDEADVFLMQRSVEDYKRNAMVSVFLRVLEYYDGIMILTSNRVGTFDAAFKSRIQLSLRYPRLEKEDRFKIWTNFVKHIEATPSSTPYGICSEEIRTALPNLAKKPLNGREIRNAISTARHLALFKKKPFGYKHLQDVIREMESFDKYARELQEDLHDDEIARRNQEY